MRSEADIGTPTAGSHLVIVEDIHQHVDLGEAFEDFATRYLYLEDVAFSYSACVACLAGVDVGHRFATECRPLTRASRLTVGKKFFTAIRFLLVDIQQFDGPVLVNADYLRHVLKWRRHRSRLSWAGKHPDHHPSNRHIPHRNPAPGHRIVGRPIVAMLWQVGHLPCMEVKQLVGWNIRRVPKSVA